MRLQKFLAQAGVASRRASEKLIEDGRVTVNGHIVMEQGVTVDPEKDIICLDGREIQMAGPFLYFMLHKPEGYITTAKDQFNRPAVTDLLSDVGARLYPVGRLDYESSGLLIMTNDGELAYHLTHPKHMVDKVYVAKVRGVPTRESIEAFRKGVQIDDYTTQPARLEIIKTYADSADIRVTIREGKNRQVRKMCMAIGHPVLRLKRIAVGKLFLGDLKRGEYRALSPSEIRMLKSSE